MRLIDADAEIKKIEEEIYRSNFTWSYDLYADRMLD